MDFLTGELRRLRKGIHDRLIVESPDYRSIVALDEAILELSRADRAKAGSAIQTYSPSQGLSKLRLRIESEDQRRRVQHADAAVSVLKRHGIPMKTPDLLAAAIKEEGARVAGQNAEVNFSSALSRDARLASITWRGSRHWWLVEREVPDEQTSEDATDTTLPGPSAASDADKGGGE